MQHKLRAALPLLLLIGMVASAEVASGVVDNSCMVYDPALGVSYWEGVRCTVDLNNDGLINDCSEMLACSKPDSGGWCDASAEPVGYKCMTTGEIFLPEGFSAIGLADFAVSHVAAGGELESCMNYDVGTGFGCQDQSCSPVYTYTCSQDGQVYITSDGCQQACGGQCDCPPGGVYNDRTGLCEVSVANPCPPGFSYSYTLGMCAIAFSCPDGSTYDPVTNQCISDTTFQCPNGMYYNADTGRCQTLPQCPGGAYYNPDLDTCQTVVCPEGYAFNHAKWRCERPQECPLAHDGTGEYNSSTERCEAPLGHCWEDPADPNPLYVRYKSGEGQDTGCGPCADCYSDPEAVEIFSPPPANYVCMGGEKTNYREPRNGNCKYDVYHHWGKPILCSSTGSVTDMRTCESTCACPSGYILDGGAGFCIRDACEAGETLDAADGVCYVDPISLGRGDCPSGYSYGMGRCESVPSCPAGSVFNASSDMCETVGTVTCPDPYTPSGSQCVHDIECPPPGYWNASRDRCEQYGQYICDLGYTYNEKSGSCEAPIECVEGSYWDTTWRTCRPLDAVMICDPGYTWDATKGICISNIICPAGSAWNSYVHTCIAEYELVGPCDAGYTWDSYDRLCRSSLICPEGSTWSPYVHTCIAEYELVGPCDAGYTWDSYNRLCQSPLICPEGSTWSPYVHTCIAEYELVGPCDTGYTWDNYQRLCQSPIYCEDGAYWDGYVHTCIATAGLVAECDPGYVWDEYNKLCQATIACPYGSHWDPYVHTCIADYELAGPCDAGYAWDDYNKACYHPIICPPGTYWDSYVHTCMTTFANDCAAFGFTWNAGKGRCEATPDCSDPLASFNPATGRCERQGEVNCPPEYVPNPPYCEIAPSCPAGSAYNPATDRCETARVETCPLGNYDCVNGACTGVAPCDSVPRTVSITGGDMALKVISFASAADGAYIAFKHSTGATVNIAFDGCMVSGSGNVSTAESFAAADDKISFYDGASTLLASITVSECTVSGGGSGGIYGPIASGGDTLDFISGIITFTPFSDYVCPFDGAVQCSSDATPVCSVEAACSVGCPAGYSYDPVKNTCYAIATCPAGGVHNTIRDMCQMNYAAELTCPAGYDVDLSLGVCYAPAACEVGTMDTAVGVCYFDTCPAGFTWCSPYTWCYYRNSLGWRYVNNHSGCLAGDSVLVCNPVPMAVSTWLSQDHCYERLPCPTNFRWCSRYQWCVFRDSLGWRYTSSRQGCMADDEALVCPDAPSANSTWVSQDHCWAKLGCPPNYRWCNRYQWCVFRDSLGWRYTGSRQGCMADDEALICPVAPSSVALWKSQDQCWERLSCPTNFRWCNRYQWCVFRDSLWWRYTGNNQGCMADDEALMCPDAPSAAALWKSQDYCHERLPCPANFRWCNRYQWCIFRDYLRWRYTGNNQGCMADDEALSCPEAPSALSAWRDQDYCYEKIGCPPHFTWCDKYTWCTYRASRGSVYMGNNFGCFGDDSTFRCLPGTNISISEGAGICYKNGGCNVPAGYRLDPATDICAGAVPKCPQPGSVDASFDKCTTPPTKVECPPGFAWNSSAGVCQRSPSCLPAISPTTGESMPVYYDDARDLCWTCPDGYILNATTGQCQADPYCPDGSVLNTATDVCETIAQVVCPPDTTFDVATGKCISVPQCPDVQCAEGCYDTNPASPYYERCNPALQPPCAPIDTYNPVYEMCTVPGTPDCPTDYTFNPAKQKCEYPPECHPTDWICPADEDPVCSSSSPYTSKVYEEIGSMKRTWAVTTNHLSYGQYVALTSDPQLAAERPDVGDRQAIQNLYGTGPFWIEGGALYQDVYFDIKACYGFQDFLNRQWRPKDYATKKGYPQGEDCPAGDIMEWERIENSCVCKTYKVEKHQRTCVGSGVTESLVSTQHPNLDVSSCVGTPVPTCTAGLDTPGLNQCGINKEEFTGSIICGGLEYSEFRTVTTCDSSFDAIIPVEYRTIPTYLKGVVRWDSIRCTPCLSAGDAIVDEDVASGPEPDIDQLKQCTDFSVFSGFDRRCRPGSLFTIFANCCSLSGWFKSWCEEEERELKKRKMARICHEVGEYCAVKIKFLGICLKKKRSYCCFSSKLARIINEQGRGQVGKGWGTAKHPDCKGFTPEEMSKLDFSAMDLTEFEQDIQRQVDSSNAPSDAVRGMQNWMNQMSNPTFGNQDK